MADSDAALGPNGGDVQSAQAQANSGFASVQIVTAAAHALLNAVIGPVPTVDNPPAGLDMQKITDGINDVRTKLTAAQATASTWVDDLSIEVGKTIPTSIMNYSSLYDAASDQIADSVAAAKNLPSDPPAPPGSPPGPRAQAQLDILSMFQALQGQVQEIKTNVDSCADRLSAYGQQLQKDHDALVGGSDEVQTLITMDQSALDSIKTDVDRLQSEVKELNKRLMDAELAVGGGIFVGVVGIALCCVPGGQVVGGCAIAVGVAGVVGGGVEWGLTEASIKSDEKKIQDDQVTKTAIEQQVIALTTVHTVTAMLVDQVAQAESALSDLRTFWASMDTMLGDVISDLGKPDALPNFSLDTVWLAASKKNWTKLNDMAEALLNITPTVTVTPASPAAAA